MNGKLDFIFKTTSITTIICFVAGFIIINTHLGQYGIVEYNVFNTQYIAAGVLYLFNIGLLLIPSYYFVDRLLPTQERPSRKELLVAFIKSIIVILFLSYFYIMYTHSPKTVSSSGESLLMNIGHGILIFFLIYEYRLRKLRWSDIPTYFFGLLIGSIFLYGMTYKNIKHQVGGGEPYYKILILNKYVPEFIHYARNNQTDTLAIIHETADKVYFQVKENVYTINKSLIEYEIIVKP